MKPTQDPPHNLSAEQAVLADMVLDRKAAIKVSTVNYGGTIPMEKHTTLVTGKGQVYFVNKFLAEKVGK